MHIAPFKVEQWMNAWETRCTYNLAETCVASITVEELLHLAGRNHAGLSDLLPMRLTYGDIKGSDPLRTAIAALYDRAAPEDVVVTHGTIGANMLVFKALVGQGDRVVSITPTYQQHTAIPASLGAEVQTLPLRAEDAWLPDLDQLRSLARGARLITLTNPNNPTGALIGREMLAQIAAIARAEGAYILCDEVYRGTAQSGDGMSTSIADLYERGISTASTSKAFSLAGLRLGWAVVPDEVVEAMVIHRDYDTISVGRINDHLAALALNAAPAILARSHRITRGNLAHLSDWVDQQPRISWVKPQAGTTALLRVETDLPSEDFCVDLLQKTGVMLTPGSAFDLEGYVRIGFANPPEALHAGLAALGDYLVQ